MNRATVTVLLFLVLAACSDADGPAVADAAAGPAGASAEAGELAQPPAGAGADRSLTGREGELVNPDDATLVFLYFDVAGITPPLDTWVEQDGRVLHAQGVDKAPMRTTVRQELEAGAAAVRGVGRIRLSLNDARLSHYDPGYGEFTVRALSPSSVIGFSAFRHNVELRFGNGRSAQVWRVPETEAGAITDRIGNYGTVQIDVLLEVTGVQPGMSGGGTLVVDILEYELRESRGGTTLGRVQVGS